MAIIIQMGDDYYTNEGRLLYKWGTIIIQMRDVVLYKWGTYYCAYYLILIQMGDDYYTNGGRTSLIRTKFLYKWR